MSDNEKNSHSCKKTNSFKKKKKEKSDFHKNEGHNGKSDSLEKEGNRESGSLQKKENTKGTYFQNGNKKNSTPLKIAMLGHKTVPARDSSRGGVEVVVEELAPRLAQMNCEVTCYNRTGCDNGGLLEYKGVKLKPVPTIKRRGLAAMTSSFFATIKATFGGYDVIHFHAEGPCFWMWIPKLFGRRCVATIHGDTGITCSRENSLFYGNDAHTGHWEYGTGELGGMAYEGAV